MGIVLAGLPIQIQRLNRNTELRLEKRRLGVSRLKGDLNVILKEYSRKTPDNGKFLVCADKSSRSKVWLPSSSQNVHTDKTIRAEALVRKAAGAGVEVILLQELFAVSFNRHSTFR